VEFGPSPAQLWSFCTTYTRSISKLSQALQSPGSLLEELLDSLAHFNRVTPDNSADGPGYDKKSFIAFHSVSNILSLPYILTYQVSKLHALRSLSQLEHNCHWRQGQFHDFMAVDINIIVTRVSRVFLDRLTIKISNLSAQQFPDSSCLRAA
jgi:hypothetical protein